MKRFNQMQSLFQWVIIMILFFCTFSQTFAQDIIDDQVCTFTIGEGSTYSGTYVVDVIDDQAYGYQDYENNQYVIEIYGNNDITIMIILEQLAKGQHVFSMEMQVAIDISVDGGNNYVGFSNYTEEGGGYIQIDEIDKDQALLSGAFNGTFHEDMMPEGINVEVSGTFHVRME